MANQPSQPPSNLARWLANEIRDGRELLPVYAEDVRKLLPEHLQAKARYVQPAPVRRGLISSAMAGGGPNVLGTAGEGDT